jgi:hypothetical protein
MIRWIGFKLRRVQLLDFQEQEAKSRNLLTVVTQRVTAMTMGTVKESML